MTKLYLGVVDIPYAYEQATVNRNGKPSRKRRAMTSTLTTGQIADFLEAKYQIMETFFEEHSDDIIKDITDAYEGALENLELGGPAVDNPAIEAMDKTEQRFRDFLTNREMDRLVAGVPTQAALEGVSHRFAHPYAKRGSRPSFIDTGQYQASFKAWMGEF